jgi:hypothetical protein
LLHNARVFSFCLFCILGCPPYSLFQKTIFDRKTV